VRERTLVANRGEIAIRICRGVRAAGYDPVVIYSLDDVGSLHASATENRHALPGTGPAAYLDIDQVVDAAVTTGCAYVHPGYGFLSENADFARACEAAGLTFIGPSPSVLELFGDKAAARDLAEKSGVPVVPGRVVDSPADVVTFMKDAPGAPALIKAIAGGGGRGIRLVKSVDQVESAFRMCREEALVAFGTGELYVERYLPHARHIEVQVVADRHDAVIHLWDRDCSIQRNNQKLVEIAPARSVAQAIRQAIWGHSIALAKAAGYAGVGTFEFLVWEVDGREDYAFIEANARLQVEHTVTEMVTGVDLVRTQMQIAAGRPLSSMAAWAAAAGEPSGDAVQLRVNAETLIATGEVSASQGRIQTYFLPSGPGVRVDGYGYAGYELNPRFDSLLTKIIAHSPHGGVRSAFDLARHALRETRIDGVRTNLDVLWAILTHFLSESDHLTTRFIDENRTQLLELAASYESLSPTSAINATGAPDAGEEVEDSERIQWMRASTGGVVVGLAVSEGDSVTTGAELATVEAMKMEHAIVATAPGTITGIRIDEGTSVTEGQALIAIAISSVDEEPAGGRPPVDLDEIRPDLAAVLDRRSRTLDEHRSDVAARRHAAGRLTAREIVSHLCDPGSLHEYGSLVLAARRRTTDVDDLLTESPADGIITGTAHINGDQFGQQAGRAVVAVSDYTVYAGTQGIMQHDKLNRMIAVAGRTRSPMVLWAEGAGGRGSDTDSLTHTPNTFHDFARLSGRVPLVGVVGGRCFAGNAVLLGCCDVVIATKNSSIGLGGPVMIEGGGLGQVAPDEVGPAVSGFASGVVDILEDDDLAAVAMARKYLSYFQGSLDTWTAEDQRLLRHVVPRHRKTSYDIRDVIKLLADKGTFLELRGGFGRAMVTGLVRIEGVPFGVIANNPKVSGGAIDSDAADKASRLMQLCDAHGLPILSLCDTPGNMIGPTAEATGLVRHCSRPFVVGSNLTVPIFAVLVRKAYGLGRQSMLGGSMRAPQFTVAWPGAEYGSMGLEGQVKAGRKRELEALEDRQQRERRFQEMVDELFDKARAINAAAAFSVDEVLDPADTREWLTAGIRSLDPATLAKRERRSHVDTW
jgi:acetyl/propionyl-CoA carboxylase alpha subunit/acetyl-CoA carboxylase carboxyltransferase component